MAKKKYKPYKIIRDTREKKGHGWYFRATAYCDGMDCKKLDTGDYSIEGYEDMIMIERKSIPDLWNSLMQGRERFYREMDRALKIPARYLIIEGTLKDVQKGMPKRYTRVRGETILANLISLEQKYGIHVIFTDKDHRIAQAHVRLLLKKLYQYCVDGIIVKEEEDGRPNNSK
jgi:ERCC4-type nuclease